MPSWLRQLESLAVPAPHGSEQLRSNCVSTTNGRAIVASWLLHTIDPCLPSPVCPQAAIYACKFMDAQGRGTIGDAILCLDWCMSKGVALSGMLQAGSAA